MIKKNSIWQTKTIYIIHIQINVGNNEQDELLMLPDPMILKYFRKLKKI